MVKLCWIFALAVMWRMTVGVDCVALVVGVGGDGAASPVTGAVWVSVSRRWPVLRWWLWRDTGVGAGDDAPKSRFGACDKENSLYVVDLIEIKKA